jgi:hypothetical protein
MTAGGRVFLFIKKDIEINFATGKQIQQFYNFDLTTYFLVPNMYNRILLTTQPNTYTIYPDFFTSFTTQNYNTMGIINSGYQNSNVSNFNPQLMLSISLILSSDQIVN